MCLPTICAFAHCVSALAFYTYTPVFHLHTLPCVCTTQASLFHVPSHFLPLGGFPLCLCATEAEALYTPCMCGAPGHYSLFFPHWAFPPHLQTVDRPVWRHSHAWAWLTTGIRQAFVLRPNPCTQTYHTTYPFPPPYPPFPGRRAPTIIIIFLVVPILHTCSACCSWLD